MRFEVLHFVILNLDSVGPTAFSMLAIPVVMQTAGFNNKKISLVSHCFHVLVFPSKPYLQVFTGTR